MAFFCNVSGARIVAPGVSKAIDPTNGVDECEPPTDLLIGELLTVECGQCLAHEQSLKRLVEEHEELESQLAERDVQVSTTTAELIAANKTIAELTKQLEELTKPSTPATPAAPEPITATHTADEATKPAKSGAKGK